MNEFKNDKLKAFLDQHEVTPSPKPADEWAQISTRIEAKKNFWSRIQGRFWIPLTAMGAAALIVLVSTSVFQGQQPLADDQVALLLEEAYGEVDEDSLLVGEDYLALLD